MKRVFAIAALLMLMGCGPRISVLNKEPLKAKMPADIRQLCDPVPDAPARGSSMGDLYTYTDNLVSQYGDCALRDKAKRDWVNSQGF